MILRRRRGPAPSAGPVDERGVALARAAREGAGPLPDRTSELALRYIERVAKVTPALTDATGAVMTAVGYAAHRAVEADGAPWDVTEMSVVDLPDRPPQDLLLRVVKACRRPFATLRAVDAPTWAGLVADVAAREGEGLRSELVDGLLRFGWVLRQVDLRYGASGPELGEQGGDDGGRPGA